jgi:hypothetical protein
VEAALLHGVNVTLLDLFSPGAHDPRGLHAVVWERFADEAYAPPATEPLTLASYLAAVCPEAYVEHARVGSTLAEMPLFLSPERYIKLPLEATYQAAFRGLPAYWRGVLEGGA